MKHLYYLMSLTLCVQFAVAQSTVTGNVTDDEGVPLPGATVLEVGTSNGTTTDFDGNYSITIQDGALISASFVGYETLSSKVDGQDVIDFTLNQSNQLKEVVVTALGVEKEAAQLGYAISKVSGDEVVDRPQGDIGRLLRGKAAGVNITSSNGLSGSSTNITIRGYTSITGSNQPLFVVDGVPFGSSTNNGSNFADNGTETSRFLDIDPNNIEEINVLKGLSATSLYGNRGRNGVILITTKNSKSTKGTANVTISNSTFFSDPHLPKYQDEYGGGFDQEYGWYFSNWGPKFGTEDGSVFGSWLSEVRNGQVFLNHPFRYNGVPSYIAGYEDLANGEYEYKAYQSVPNFFRTGLFNSTSVGVNGGDEMFTYNVLYTKVADEGFTPGNKLSKDNLSVGGSIKKDKLTVNASVNFALTDMKSPPVAASRGSGVEGSGASIFGDLMYTPRNVDLMGLPYQRADGGSLYYRTNNSIQNPRWTVENSKTRSNVNRFFGNVGFKYDLADNLNVTYRYGLDSYSEEQLYGQNKGGIDGNSLGFFRTTYYSNKITDHNAAVNYNTDITDKIGITAIVGFNSNSVFFKSDGLESTKQIAYGTLKHWNFEEAASTNSFSGGQFQGESLENTYGIFADLTVSLEDYLYLNGSVRNDWTSTLETGNNTILYPSGSLSFIASNFFEEMKSDSSVVDYLKIRLGYGSSAGFPSPYITRNTLSLNGRAFVDPSGNLISSNTTSNRLGNPNLMPELLSEFEIGLDTRLFNNKVGINMSYFKKKTQDLITSKELDPSTGYTFTTINGGDMEVEGVELDLDLRWFSNYDGLSWNTGVNFYADESLVTSLPEGIEQIIIGTYFASDAKNAAIVGQPFNVLIGDKIRRSDSGEKVINKATGNYIIDPNDVVIGDPNPDFIANIDNTFSFKNFTFDVGIGYRHGGDIFSKTAVTLLSRGIIDFPFDRLGTYILPGVNVDGSPNTTQIGATDIAFSNWLGTDELEIWDGTTVRLREISLGYQFTGTMLEKMPFKTLSLNLSGTNLWYKAVNFPEGVNYDTNSLSNGVSNNLGIEYFAGPSSKRYGFTVKASF
jgi:TonB-linked SusC/RagA family outer membrane protein